MVKKKVSPKKGKTTKSSKSTKKRKSKETNDGEDLDSGIVIVDDEFDVDKTRVNEERRAYLEEARSQEASE
ncbi:hypothetical protein OAK01_02635 [Candidatus Nitrosopelagicus sp.]|nr:hypothetical protein [Candidatus Nitrosopelagicus sp.]